MSHNNQETVGQNVESSDWWTPSRTKLAGLAGIIGGLGLAALSISRARVGIDPGAISQVSPIGYALLVVALLAGHARYSGGSSYGNGGRSVAIVLALSLMSYAGPIIILGMTWGQGLPLFPGIIISVAFFEMRLFGTLYGVILWRQTNASRITAGLFAVSLPAVFALAPLALIGVSAVGIELPLYLAFIALGSELLTVDADIAGSGSGNWRGEP